MTTLLQAVNLTKRFGGLTAVEHVSLDINIGEVVGLVGDNGAGKSTLIKMVAGVYQPDEGEIFFDGKKVAFSGPREARDLGIETIYQDLALAENLDVGSNIFLGREIKRPYLGGLVHTLDRTKMRDESAEIFWIGWTSAFLPSRSRSATCPAGSARPWPLPARSTGMPRWSSWTSRLPRWACPSSAKC